MSSSQPNQRGAGSPAKRRPPTDEFHRTRGDCSAQVLVDLMRDSPLRDAAIVPAAVRSPVRDVKL